LKLWNRWIFLVCRIKLKFRSIFTIFTWIKAILSLKSKWEMLLFFILWLLWFHRKEILLNCWVTHSWSLFYSLSFTLGVGISSFQSSYLIGVPSESTLEGFNIRLLRTPEIPKSIWVQSFKLFKFSWFFRKNTSWRINTAIASRAVIITAVCSFSKVIFRPA